MTRAHLAIVANVAIVSLILAGTIAPGSPILEVFPPVSRLLPVLALTIAALLIRPVATREWVAAIDIALAPWSAVAILFLLLGSSGRGETDSLIAWSSGLFLLSLIGPLASRRSKEQKTQSS